MPTPRLYTGIKPTGKPHVGNYIGAVKPFIELQKSVPNGFFCVVDYHGLISVQNKAEMRSGIFDITRLFLAAGLDAKRIKIYKQSDVSEHTELTWIFNCLVTVPYMMRAHAYKDAVAKGNDVNVGLFSYPILMAADILLYETTVVPVGQDQKQHIEYARDIAQKFNNTFGETFILPEGHITEDNAVLPGTDGRKMSKSYNNVIPLFESEDAIRAAVMSIITDSKGVQDPKDPEGDNVFALHRFFSTKELPDLEKRYREGGIGYKESKEILSENILKEVRPLKERINSYSESDIRSVLEEGAEAARAIASKTMKVVRERIGVTL